MLLFAFFQEKINLKEKTDNVIAGIVEDSINNFVPNRRNAIQNLDESRFIFSAELSEIIMVIKAEFDNICAILGQYQTLNNHLSFEEKHIVMPEMREEFLKKLNDSCHTINEQNKVINEAMNRDMTFTLTED